MLDLEEHWYSVRVASLLEGLAPKPLNHGYHISCDTLGLIPTDESGCSSLNVFQGVDIACQVRIPNCRGVLESWTYHGCIGNRLHLGCTLADISPNKTYRVLLALVVVSSICFFQVKSSLMVTPVYLLLSTISNVCPCIW